jgi:hypothetical protein
MAGRDYGSGGVGKWSAIGWNKRKGAEVHIIRDPGYALVDVFQRHVLHDPKENVVHA